MRSTSSVVFFICASLVVLLGTLPRSATAQLVGLETVPLAAGDQFFFAPSRNEGMAGPSIAFDDPLLDPFVNPAKGSRLSESQLFGSPTAYSVSEHNGGARTLPVGMLLTSSAWFGGAVAAIQQLDMGGDQRLPIGLVEPGAMSSLPPGNAMVDRSSTNKYFQVFLGRRLGDSGLSLGASVLVADLNGTDGVEDLFVNAWDVTEFGSVQDYRVGVTARWSDDRTFEAVLVHNRFDVTQDVTSVDWTLTDSVNWLWTPDVRDQTNLNKTRTWGAHLGYVQPVGESGWRIGGALTANRKLHPKIPTYDVASVQFVTFAPIPRDPGESWAYALGLGVSRRAGPTTFAMDLVYEPAVSDTWADAEADTVLADGNTLFAGGHTVDNRFVFSNARLNVGLDREIGRGAIQIGFRARHVDYRLDQDDHLQGTSRTQTEQWTEWTPTWGFRYSWATVELRYTGSASSASHFPFFGATSSLVKVEYAASPVTLDSDLLAPPTGPLRIPEETTVTHRLAVSVPIR